MAISSNNVQVYTTFPKNLLLRLIRTERELSYTFPAD